jgi:hypothetical protein
MIFFSTIFINDFFELRNTTLIYFWKTVLIKVAEHVIRNQKYDEAFFEIFIPLRVRASQSLLNTL